RRVASVSLSPRHVKKVLNKVKRSRSGRPIRMVDYSESPSCARKPSNSTATEKSLEGRRSRSSRSGGTMRGKHAVHGLLQIALSATLVGGNALTLAQTRDLPRALPDSPQAGLMTGQPASAATANRLEQPMPYAPRPLPGPAEAGWPVGGTDAQAP